jgi:hypothetical protein
MNAFFRIRIQSLPVVYLRSSLIRIRKRLEDSVGFRSLLVSDGSDLIRIRTRLEDSVGFRSLLVSYLSNR